MRVLLSTYDSRGGVEPLVALAVRLQELGAEALVCAPPDCAERLAEVGVPLVPAGEPVRALVHAAKPPSPDDVPRLTAELIATWFDKVAAAAEGCDALVASGVIPAAVGARSVAEKLGIHSVHVSYCPIFLPSPHHAPHPLPGRPLAPDVTDNQVLWDLNAQGYNAVFGAALNTHRVANGLPPVDNVRHYLLGDHPWLATDPVLAPWQEPADLDVVQTGAWILPDERPLPAELEAFLDAGLPPVYVGFGSMRAPADIARAAIEATRTQGCRALVARGWADLAPIDDQDDCLVVGEANQQALFSRVAAVVHHGGAGTTTTATQAGVPQVVVPQWADQPYFASRVASLGIGAAHDVQAPTTESLSAALRTALTPETRARATAVPARSAPTGRRWPRNCYSTGSADKPASREPRHRHARPARLACLVATCHNPAMGWQVQGWPRFVVRRGQLVLADDEITARPGEGEWLRRVGTAKNEWDQAGHASYDRSHAEL